MSLDRHPASVDLGLSAGDEVKIEALGDADEPTNGVGPVAVDINRGPR